MPVSGTCSAPPSYSPSARLSAPSTRRCSPRSHPSTCFRSATRTYDRLCWHRPAALLRFSEGSLGEIRHGPAPRQLRVSPARSADRRRGRPAGAPLSRNSRAHARVPCFACSAGKTVPRPAMRGLRGAAARGGHTTSTRAPTCPRSARSGSERRGGPRRAFEFCGSRECVPWFHENALLRVGGLDDDRADDGTRPAGGECQGTSTRRREPCSSVDALLLQSQIGAAPDGALSALAGRPSQQRREARRARPLGHESDSGARLQHGGGGRSVSASPAFVVAARGSAPAPTTLPILLTSASGPADFRKRGGRAGPAAGGEREVVSVEVV